MGQVSGTCVQALTFQDYVTAGKITPQTYTVSIAAPGITGASITYTSGTGAGQIDSLYSEPIALAANTPQTINLQSLTGLGGESLVLARAREFILFNPSAYDCKAYQGATNPWAMVPPSTAPLWARAGNGCARISDPNSTGAGVGNVVTATSCEVTLDPGANAFTVYLIVAGGSAA